MRHQCAFRKLGVKSPHRKAMLANLAAALVKQSRIATTLPRAKELRRIADKLITLGKQQSLSARRAAIALIRDKDAVHKVFAELAGHFAGRNGGYTRLYKLGFRHGDSAPMAVIEYVGTEKKHEHHEGDEHKHDKAKHKEHGKKPKMTKKASDVGTESKSMMKTQAKRSPAKAAAGHLKGSSRGGGSSGK